MILFFGVAFTFCMAPGTWSSRRPRVALGGHSATAMTSAACGRFGGVGETRTHGHLRNAVPILSVSVASRVLLLFSEAPMKS